MLVDTFHYTILCRDFPYFLFEKKRKYAKKNFHASRNRPAARWRPKWGRRSSRFARSLRTFFLRKKESTQRKTLTLRATGRQQDGGRKGKGCSRFAQSLRTFFLREKESTQRKTLTLRATGWRQDKGRNEGLALRAIARARQGGTFGCGQRRNGVQWKKEKIPCDDRGKGGKNDA